MKAFKVTGEINKPELQTPFAREVIADKSEHAVEKVYADIGSRHRVKRYHIKIISTKELTADEIENPIVKEDCYWRIITCLKELKPKRNFDRLSMEMRYLEQTAEALQQRISMVNAAITDLTYANATLDGIEKEKENAEMLVPIGGSSYVKVKLADANKVIVGMGSGVSVEKSLADAKATLKERLDELEKTMTSAQQQFSQVAERINSGRGRLESLLSEQDKGNSRDDV